jgi:phosphopantetheinyl transferase
MRKPLILAYRALPPGGDATALGRALLFGLLGEVTGGSYDASHLQFGSRGRPAIAGAPDFNIAHCAGAVAVAVCARGFVGVDLEPTGRSMAGALRKVCDAEELRLANLNGAAHVWVAKEAAIKCLGLSALMAGQVRLGPRHALMRGQVLHLRRPLLAAGFEVAVASTAAFADNEIELRQAATA